MTSSVDGSNYFGDSVRHTVLVKVSKKFLATFMEKITETTKFCSMVEDIRDYRVAVQRSGDQRLRSLCTLGPQEVSDELLKTVRKRPTAWLTFQILSRHADMEEVEVEVDGGVYRLAVEVPTNDGKWIHT
jgi:hypothetical protein